jgi:hypothetical protein
MQFSLARLVIAIVLVAFAVPTAGADAKGTVRVQQSDGSTQTYDDVAIRVVKAKSLNITTADGVGTLVIDNAACSYVGAVKRCLLYGAQLQQGGATKPIDFDRGTLYANLTGEKQPLPLTSQQIPPKSVIMAFRTKIGTYVTLTGRIDSGVDQ